MTENLASRTVTALAAVALIGDTVPSEHPMRHAVRDLKRKAEQVLDNASSQAYDMAMLAGQIVKDFDKEQAKGQKP